jgi:hypothetical protein
MWNEYKIEEDFDAVAQGICETLVDHCAKGARVESPLGPNHPAWFKVSMDTKRTDGELVARAEGMSGTCHFRFRSDRNGASLSADFFADPKRILDDFIIMMQAYRKSKGLSPLNNDYLYRYIGKACPPVTEQNYAAFTGAQVRALQDVLETRFGTTSASMAAGPFALTVYSENAANTTVPPDMVSICRKFLDDFKRCYAFDDALFVHIRTNAEQHVYLSVRGGGLFYNVNDTSGPFLEREHAGLLQWLSILPNKDMLADWEAKSTEELARQGVRRSDFGYRREGETYTLYIDGEKTAMRICPAYPVAVSLVTGKTEKTSDTLLFWMAKGATFGKHGGRTYRSLDAALEGERVLVSRLFMNGNKKALFAE